MFAIDDHVFYGGTGVCRITAVKSLQFGNAEAQEYYVLQPLGTDSLTYVSTTSEAQLAHMRHLLTREEILALIHGMPFEESVWLDNERKRAELFSTKLRTGNCHDLVGLVRTLYHEQNQKRGMGKRLTYADARVMDAAERLLHEEFAFVLGMRHDEVVSFIEAQLGPPPCVEQSA